MVRDSAPSNEFFYACFLVTGTLAALTLVGVASYYLAL